MSVAPAGEPRTHRAIDPRSSGEPVALEPGRARVRLDTTPRLAADERGLVHGGFLFSLADYTAMLAVNEPNVVLAAAEMRFLAPVEVGETLVASGQAEATRPNRYRVRVEVGRSRQGESEAGEIVAQGDFDCVVPERHVLEPPR